MGFLAGPISFQCFRISGSQPRQFGVEHVKVLKKYAIGQIETSSLDQPDVGFLAGAHLLDREFNLEKNVIGDALHCAMRVDTNQIPAAVRKAWLQMELAASAAENESGRPTKAQRQQAKEAVEARCQEEAQTGKFRRMQQFPLLWDAKEGILYLGATSPKAGEHCTDLCRQAFDLELGRLTASRRVLEWATEAKRRKLLDDVSPSVFRPGESTAEIAWWDFEEDNYDFLGNEFLLWLWWRWETQSDAIALPDDSEVTGMFARTLALECPRGESGKETITAEAPVKLPEAVLAIRSGKLPRRAGLILARHGEQYEFVLQAETFSVSGAKIQAEEQTEGQDAAEARVESLRRLNETLDLLFRAFCQRRVGKDWLADLKQIRRWLKSEGGEK